MDRRPARFHARSRHPLLRLASGLCLAFAATGCLLPGGGKPQLAYAPPEFREAIRERVPGIPPVLAEPPFLLDEETLDRARRIIAEAPRGPARIQLLVDFLGAPPPEGLGLDYDWAATGSAKTTLELRRGNCVALANVIVGIGRELGWPIYYVEIRSRFPETEEFESLRAVSDHMGVLIAARTHQQIVDFTGLIEHAYAIRPIDDLTAYAHVLNNLSAQRVLSTGRAPDPTAWTQALEGFELASRVAPELGRTWNNMGIALSRLGRFDEARRAYQRAVELDTAFGSAERNLVVMETRALGEPQILERPVTP